MGSFISNFDTTAEFTTFSATADCLKPHVSLTKDNGELHYLEYDPYMGHEYVEIGGLKWATMNIGANSITDIGLYFQWGDTQGYTASQVGSGEGQKYFNWDDYKYGGAGSGGQTKYNSNDGKTVLDASDDAARANWGSQWRMPTIAEFHALHTATTAAWTSNYEGSGIKGLILTDKNDSSKVLFFPATGRCLNGSVKYGDEGDYWSSSLHSSYLQNAFSLYTASYYTDSQNNNENRYNGMPVRAVFG